MARAALNIATGRVAPKDETSSRDRIIDAAYQCFNHYGIRKTTIDDIASMARVARPTFYNYFSGKNEIVDYLRQLELVRVNQEIRARMKKYASFSEALTEAISLSVTVARDNPYVRSLIEDSAIVSAASVPNSDAQRIHLERWGPLLKRASDHGELKADLSIEEVVSWLTLTQQLLLTKLEADPMADGDLRRFVLDFIVAPVLAQPASGPAPEAPAQSSSRTSSAKRGGRAKPAKSASAAGSSQSKK